MSNNEEGENIRRGANGGKFNTYNRYLGTVTLKNGTRPKNVTVYRNLNRNISVVGTEDNISKILFNMQFMLHF